MGWKYTISEINPTEGLIDLNFEHRKMEQRRDLWDTIKCTNSPRGRGSKGALYVFEEMLQISKFGEKQSTSKKFIKC